VAKRDVLARVERDLRLGHVHPALQRLASLAAAYPGDLEVRARRAAVNRQIGNLVEAGRWGFLTEDVAAAELRAFERALPRASARLAALRIPDDPTLRLGPRAERRYRDLLRHAATGSGRQAAMADDPATPTGGDPTAPDRSSSLAVYVPFLAYAVSGLILLCFAIVGIVAVIRAAV
jgi:hypothetical protein